jgi:hypothetical protein
METDHGNNLYPRFVTGNVEDTHLTTDACRLKWQDASR